MNASVVLNDLRLIVPELIVMAALAVLIVYDLRLGRRQAHRAAVVGVAALGAAALVLAIEFFRTATRSAQTAFSGMLAVDAYASFFRLLVVVAALGALIFALLSRELEDYRAGDFTTLLLCATLGMMFMASARHFLMLYLAMETLSLGSYALAGFAKRDRFSTEAALKYLIFGAVASGVMLFGLSYLYGLTGSLSYDCVFSAEGVGSRFSILAVLLMVLVGFGFKIAAVPFHFWAPDVYQGSPTPVTAFLAVGSKAAGMAMLLRFFAPLFDGLGSGADWAAAVAPWRGDFRWLLWLMSAATMTFGNLAALRQWDIKRLLAYSSIAHAGYMLMGVVVLDRAGFQAVLFYLVAYLFMNLGAFLVAVAMINESGSADFRRWRGTAGRLPLVAVLMGVFLFSLTGIPPTVGFVGKLLIFKAVIEAGLREAGQLWFYVSLALVGGVNTVLSLYYYVKVLKAMIVDEEERPSALVGARMRPAAAGLLLMLGVPVIALGVYFGPLIQMTAAAAGLYLH
ncbi:MAG: NADH-quinone oxidoreductase subunit N [Candidatus Sumerlaeia bacterium]